MFRDRELGNEKVILLLLLIVVEMYSFGPATGIRMELTAIEVQYSGIPEVDGCVSIEESR